LEIFNLRENREGAVFRYTCWDSSSNYLMPKQPLTPNHQSTISNHPGFGGGELLRLRLYRAVSMSIRGLEK
jgi:hypothetical protein